MLWHLHDTNIYILIIVNHVNTHDKIHLIHMIRIYILIHMIRIYILIYMYNHMIDRLIDWLWMLGSPGRTHLSIRWCTTCVVNYNLPPPSELGGEQYWYMGKSLRVFTALFNKFYQHRVFFVLGRFFYFHPQCQGRRHLRFMWYMRATRGTPPNVEQRNFFFFRFFQISICIPPPLDHFSWSHSKSLYLDCLDFNLHPPPWNFFPEATIKVYSWILSIFKVYTPRCFVSNDTPLCTGLLTYTHSNLFFLTNNTQLCAWWLITIHVLHFLSFVSVKHFQTVKTQVEIFVIEITGYF